MKNISSKLVFSILYPTLFVIILWTILLFEKVSHVELGWYGLYPRTFHGLLGIITSPLLHADYNHLLSNTVPLLILGSVMFYFYRPIAFQVFFWVYVMTGIWVWVAAQDGYHIGASGLIYGFVTFLFFSGVFRKDTRLLSISLFVAFFYGGILYGIFPVQKGVSWESHLMGSIAGLITAYHFRKEGPVARKYDLGDDDENEDTDVTVDENPDIIEEAKDFSPLPPEPPPTISYYYTYVPKEKEEGK